MNQIREIGIKCGHCGTAQPSGIKFGDEATFDSAALSGNRQSCMKCGNLINVNKENMCYILSDGKGGFVGDDYSGNVEAKR